MGTFGRTLVGLEPRIKGHNDTLSAVVTALKRYDRCLTVHKGLQYWGKTEVPDGDLVTLPESYIPGENDLPPKGTGLDADIVGAEPGTLYWEYACVLIAIVKHEGDQAVLQKIGKSGAKLATPRLSTKKDKGPVITSKSYGVVQALHDYYLAKGVQYDDSSKTRQVLKEWGFDLIFTGPVVLLADLCKHIELKKGGKYIFDIDGHTVKVDLLKDLAKQANPIANVDEYFRFESDPQNYEVGKEKTKRILYIYQKGR